MELNLGELVKTEIQLKDSGFEKARVSWHFSSGAVIRGGRITISKHSTDGLWVQLPKYRSRNGKWVNIVRLPDHLEKFIERETLKSYKAQQDDSQADEVTDEELEEFVKDL